MKKLELTHSAEHEIYLRSLKKRARLVTAVRLLLLAVFILLWELAADTGRIDPFIVSSPSRIIRTLAGLMRSGELPRHVFATLYETVVGFAAGTALGTAAAAGEDFVPALEAVRARYGEIVEGLGVSFDLDGELAVIAEHLSQGPQRDYMASRGEYLNAKLMAAWLGWDFLDTAAFIRFRPDGVLDPETTYALLGEAMAKTERAVLPGFYGADETGRWSPSPGAAPT